MLRGLERHEGETAATTGEAGAARRRIQDFMKAIVAVSVLTVGDAAEGQRPCRRQARQPTPAMGRVQPPPAPVILQREAARNIEEQSKPKETELVPTVSSILRTRAGAALEDFLQRETWQEAEAFPYLMREGTGHLPRERHALIALRSRLAKHLRVKLRRGESFFPCTGDPQECERFPWLQRMLAQAVVTDESNWLGDASVVDFTVDHTTIGVKWGCSSFAYPEERMGPYPIYPSVVAEFLPNPSDRDLTAILFLRLAVAETTHACGTLLAKTQELQSKFQGKKEFLPWEFNRHTPKEIPALEKRRQEQRAKLGKLHSALRHRELLFAFPRDRTTALLLSELRDGKEILSGDVGLGGEKGEQQRAEFITLLTTEGERAVEFHGIGDGPAGKEMINLLITDRNGDGYGVDETVAARILRQTLEEESPQQ